MHKVKELSGGGGEGGSCDPVIKHCVDVKQAN